MKSENGSGPRLLFVAGGTGGHLFPALAVADRCRDLAPDATIRFVGARGRMEEEVVPRAGYDLDLLRISGFDRRLTLKNSLLPFKLVGSLVQSFRIVRHFRPDGVICAGAYVSWPVGTAATLLGVPLILMESNALPGMVVRRLAPKAREVHVAFQEAKERLPGARVILSGNPVRRSLHNLPDPREARMSFGLDPDRQTLLAFGGSLGARSINNALDMIVEKLLQEGIQVIWQTGKNYQGEELRDSRLYRTQFLYTMDQGYAAADLVLSRAGATTIAELKTVGRPSILVPLPTAADDHQRINAEAMVEAGASRMISDSQLEESLYGTIIEMMGQNRLLSTMGEAAGRLALLDADDRIARSILSVVGSKS